MPRNTDAAPVPENLTQEWLDLERRRMELLERQVALQEQQAAALQSQVEHTKPKDNPNYVTQSLVLQPNGEPWASKLKCRMFQGNNILLNRTVLTEGEVEVLNQIEPIEDAVIQKTDASDARITVTVIKDAQGRVDKMVIGFPMGKDSSPQHFGPIADLDKKTGKLLGTGRGWAEQLVAQIKARSVAA